MNEQLLPNVIGWKPLSFAIHISRVAVSQHILHSEYPDILSGVPGNYRQVVIC